MIEVRDRAKNHGSLRVLDDFSLAVQTASGGVRVNE